MREAIPEPNTEKIAFHFRQDEIEALRAVAHHYEKVMGAARHIVIATAPSRIRRRYRYILQESVELEQAADHWRSAASSEGVSRIEMTSAQAVAFWGRLLSNLKTKRSRRRLSKQEVDAQERAADTLKVGLALKSAEAHQCIERDMATRRRREQEWMTEALSGQDVVH